MEVNSPVTTGKPKGKGKGNKKPEKEKDPKGKNSKGKGKDIALNYAKFEGQGLNYKCKLFGCAEVPGPRGDKTCIQAIHTLKQNAKMMKKGTNEHKLKVIFNITLEGVKLIVEKTQTIVHVHQIHKISFISHDPEDRHVFGYIYSPPRVTAGEGRKYLLFAIKSEKSADVITCQLYELFQVVYKMQENKKLQSKDETPHSQKSHDRSAQPLEPLQDKMLLEMSNKLGGEQQYPADEHVYAVPSDLPVHTSSNGESKPDETTGEKNGFGEVNTETVSAHFAVSSFAQDPFTSNGTQEEVAESDKEATAVSHIFSENVFTSSSNKDSGFESGFDSAASLASAEHKFDDPFQFHAEFPPYENGFTSLSAGPEESQETNVPIAAKQPSSTEQLRVEAFKSSVQIDTNSDKNDPFRNIEKESDQVTADESALSSSRNDQLEIKSDKNDDIHGTDMTNVVSNKTELEVSTDSDPNADHSSKVEGKHSKDNNLDNPTPLSSFASGPKDNESTVNQTEYKGDGFGSTDFFEARFETENDAIISAEDSKKDPFSSFASSSDAFPNEDLFSSSSVVEDDKTSFGAFDDDDPFSPRGGTNEQKMSNPFTESDNIFSGVFSSAEKNNDDFFSGNKNEPFTEMKHKTEETVENEDDDVFEVDFEAKMEAELKDEINDEQHESSSVTTVMNSVRASDNIQTDNAEPKESEEVSSSSVNDSKADVVVEDVPLAFENVVEGKEDTVNKNGVEQEPGEHGGVTEVNTFDLSTNDVYVTLKTAAPSSPGPSSPCEFSPPPLPPRPSFPIFLESPDSPVIPNEPPALPPRPSNQSLNSETVMRKPPELPPRVDLEEKNCGVFSSSTEDSKVESRLSDSASPLFQTNFDSFDFNNFDDNSDTSFGQRASTTADFDGGDPFKDPFAGADPFQTPIATDPFASSPSYAPDNKQGSVGFDPFSGDDPFAATLTFDEPGDQKNDDKQFADFSSFPTSFS